MNNDFDKKCCFFGHRKIEKSQELIDKLSMDIEKIIVDNNVATFFFGSKSQFDDLCYEVVSQLKEKYTHIKRVYVRAAYADIDESYTDYLLGKYEDTYYPEKMRGAGKASYVERNQEMIDKSDFCICYYDENYLPPRRRNSRRDLFDYQPKSGTKVAYDYAVKKEKQILNVFNK